ncbi:nucleotidyltransferase domain-containing protein [Paenibacillus guangzhouensis]|uniref:nucleotidyltransferase domain-containing protein n=1 Tax=Paenibacillus guangzhouensis TaxID=1473112 RepID=UPI001266D643|nr:nucleotidyltransferase domain-containing protein [Paenibacillus guangzhouensis]
MFHVFDVSSALVSHIEQHCPDDIAIVACYGSYVQGTANPKSDLDFFFIPATSDGYRASIQFIIDGISFDFWPIGWDRAERMANYEESNTSIIADCRLLYARSDADRERFYQLQEKIKNPSGLNLLDRAETELQRAYVHLYKMRSTSGRENLAFFRIESQEVLTKVLYSLALINGTYLRKGWGKNMDQILNFEIRPARLADYIHTLVHSNSCQEMQVNGEELVQETVELLVQQKESYTNGPSYTDRMRGFYEEFKGIFNKLTEACEKKDRDTAYFWSVSLQDIIAKFLYYSERGYWPVELEPNLVYQDIYVKAGFPNLVDLFDAQNLLPLERAVQQLESKFREHIVARGVEILEFHSVEQFREFLHTRA